jgi:protein-tyrosine phosphatase
MEDFDDFDIIFAMDQSNYNNLRAMAPSDQYWPKIRLIMNEAYPGENRAVPDPYTGGQDGFEKVYAMLDLAIEKFLKKV